MATPAPAPSLADYITIFLAIITTYAASLTARGYWKIAARVQLEIFPATPVSQQLQHDKKIPTFLAACFACLHIITTAIIWTNHDFGIHAALLMSLFAMVAAPASAGLALILIGFVEAFLRGPPGEKRTEAADEASAGQLEAGELVEPPPPYSGQEAAGEKSD